ncbi:GPW/gp25 family protein [Myxococcus vastator]|uniref:GPW/gp25 family protein n=1 Tax=Myxococcus vastator TaxID=2709664 RepID=UPI0013D1E38C|nr:GPW/gp25 family protein [Myxococcus vastator]
MLPKPPDRRPPVGFPLRLMPDERGELAFPTLEASVRQSIEVILRTRPGEQLMRQGFGAGLERMMGQPNTVSTRRRIQELVQRALTEWEPRLELIRVDVLEVADLPAQVRVEIVYRLRRTGDVQQLGLAMDLGG